MYVVRNNLWTDSVCLTVENVQHVDKRVGNDDSVCLLRWHRVIISLSISPNSISFITLPRHPLAFFFFLAMNLT